MKNRRTIAFWCKRCRGRVFEEEIFWEARSLNEEDINTKIKKVELTCLLCARSNRVPYKDYQHLLKEIERVLSGRPRGKNNAKQVLS